MKQKKVQTVKKPTKNIVVFVKDLAKEAGKSSPKQLKCFHYGWVNITEDNCFIFHPDKHTSSVQEYALETKIGTLEERFKNLASFGQILDSPTPSEPRLALALRIIMCSEL